VKSYLFTTQVIVLLVMATALPGAEIPDSDAALEGEAAEIFLRTAEIVDLESYETKGITRPRRAVLTMNGVTLRAVFKDVDTLDLKWKTGSGRVLFNVIDSYKHEIASYELDKLLGLGMVPPTVERRIGRDVGSLQLWVEGAMTEWSRRKVEKLSPPDMGAWNDRISTIKLYLQLIWDTDFNNISNVMVDSEWRVWKVDASRAFYVDPGLRREESLTRFSRPLLAALEDLDREELEQTLGPWLNPKQIKTLWQRRDRILELARERVAEFGESVLYD
jgi:hypothetical protein